MEAVTATPANLWKSFACTNCGAAVEVVTGAYAVSVSCGNCRAVIDASDEAHGIIAAAEARTANHVLPMGSRGTLNGAQWQVVGFLQRADGEDRWSWSEYLLFNPYRGFRWLVHSEGAFTLVETLQEPLGPARKTIEFEGVSYRQTHRGNARVDDVSGEFYWRVGRGDMATVADYESNGGSTLSFERTPLEVTWSRGEPVNKHTLQAAFPMIEDSAFESDTDSQSPFDGGDTSANYDSMTWNFIGGVLVIAMVQLGLFGAIGAFFICGFIVHRTAGLTPERLRKTMKYGGFIVLAVALLMLPSFSNPLGGGVYVGRSYYGK